MGLGTLSPAEAWAEAAVLVPLVDDPGRFQAAWAYVPQDRPGAEQLKAMPAPQGAVSDRVELPVALEAGDPGFSVDIKARGTEALWKAGGTALLLMRAREGGARTLRVGLPKGGALYLDGRRLVAAARDERVPEAVSLEVEVRAGPHWIAVTLPKAAPSWDGRGFFMRWLTARGEPDAGLSFELPVADSPAATRAMRAAALAPEGGRAHPVRLEWRGERPVWAARIAFGPNLPGALRRAEGLRLGLRTAWAADGVEVRCAVAPMGRCEGDIDWRASSGRRIGDVVLEARAAGWRAELGRWGGDRRLRPEDVTLRRRATAALGGPGVAAMPEGSRASVALVTQELEEWLAGSPEWPGASGPLRDLKEVRGELEGMVEALTKGRDPVAGARGLHQRGYRSPLDGRYQPYALVVPPEYDARVPHPLMVGLHGHRGTPARMCEAMLGGRGRPPKHAPPFVALCPFGYGDTAFRYVGEDDLFRALAEVERELSIDPERIALVGASDGGLAAFEVALHHPDRWSAVAPLAGVADMRAFASIGASGHTPYEAAWLRRVSAAERAMNGSNLEFVIAFGGRDRLEPRWVEGIASALRGHGAKVEYTLHPRRGHNVWDVTFQGGALFKRLITARREAAPRAIHYRAWSPRRRGAWDVVIDEADWGSGAEIHVEHQSDRIEVAAKGVRRARVGLRGASRLDVGGRAFTLSGEAAELRWDGAGGVSVGVASGAASPPTWPAPGGQRGRLAAARGGPLDEVRAGAQLYVFGTGEPGATALYRYLAELERRRWGRGVTLRSRVMEDAAVDAATLARRHVVLVGTPGALAPRLRKLLPETTAPAAAGEDPGLRGLAPHPDGAGLWIVAVTGATPRGVVWGAHLPEILPSRVWATSEAVLPPFGMVAGGRAVVSWE